MWGGGLLAGGEVAAILEAAEDDLDVIAASVKTLIVSDGLEPEFTTWNAGLDALRLQGIPEPVSVIATVAEQPVRLRQIVQQRCCTDLVADQPSGHEEAYRAAVRMGDDMQLRIHTVLGAADQLPEILYS